MSKESLQKLSRAEDAVKKIEEGWVRLAEKGGPDVISLMKESVWQWRAQAFKEEEGEVLTVGDGIALVSGMDSVFYGEILIFSAGIRGMVQDLRADHIGCVLFGDDREIEAGTKVRRTGRVAGVPVGEAFLGRVVDALGSPIDGLGDIVATGYLPVENEAPGIIDREGVNVPLDTGILTIDSMFPIGRGQRELIIGDRSTGKTAIAIDTILNQKGKDVICIYVAIGQKMSSVARITEILRSHDALPYSIVVVAGAGESAPLQYIAPYAGCAMGEYFMNRGRDVLIIYDDLSKHAVAYRALSLLLERPPGREAYPGDVFYLHSRLLERSAHLSEDRGGGSMTALPIVETLAGDISAYIPTNVISITDGQIFLESSLFFLGQRPAVNIGLSVSRVGGDAQTKAMKKAAGTIRLALAQYREMEVFNQFSSDLDENTKGQLKFGQTLMELLKQSQYHPMSEHQEVSVLSAGLAHVMQDIPIYRITEFKNGLIQYLEEKDAFLMQKIDESGELTDDEKGRIIQLSKEYKDSFVKV